MPELPEVENVRLGLRRLLPKGSRSKSLTLFRADLRFPFPERLGERLAGEVLIDIHRRAKYLVFETERFLLVSHLGMTGSWRELRERERHDHLIWEFESGLKLVFNDPRRFGFISLFDQGTVPGHFIGLGPEPLAEQFNADYLFGVSRKKTKPLKNFLLDQQVVAGLGNIYVCEALFAAGLSPLRRAGRLTLGECGRLVVVIRKILKTAIRKGGSTIRDYRNADGVAGSFQERFRVYGRTGETCRVCAGQIQIRRQAGRSTFWCRTCQK